VKEGSQVPSDHEIGWSFCKETGSIESDSGSYRERPERARSEKGNTVMRETSPKTEGGDTLNRNTGREIELEDFKRESRYEDGDQLR